MRNGNDSNQSEKLIAELNHESFQRSNAIGATAPPDYFQTQQQTVINNFQHISNPNFQCNQPQTPYPMGINNSLFDQPRAPYATGTNNYQFNQPQVSYIIGLNNSDFEQPQLPYQTGINKFHFNQPQAPCPIRMANSQFNPSQAPYSMGMNNSQFNQPLPPYHMGINNAHFGQPPHQTRLNHYQFNQPQHQTPLDLQTTQSSINANNALVSHTQTSNLISANPNEPTEENELIVNRPHNYMKLAVLSCLCCFFPVGLCAIIKAFEVDSALISSDFTRAQKASIAAKTYAKIAVIIGCLIICGIVSSIIIFVLK